MSSRRHCYLTPYIPTNADITNPSQSPLLKCINDLNPDWWPKGIKPRSFIKASLQVIKPSIQPTPCFSDGTPVGNEAEVPYWLLNRASFSMCA